jgi:AcrR family transcriptional regulator
MATATVRQDPPRTPLDRQRVLSAALALVDAEGLEALSMRRLGAELGVEAMSLYKHVANKDALLDGLVEQLWTEVGDATAEQTDWADQLRSYARGVRAMMHRHPQAASLLFSRCVLATRLLDNFATLVDTLRGAGFDQATAARTVRSLCSYAMGYASNELYCFGAWRTEPGQAPVPTTGEFTMAVNTTDMLLWLGRTLPASTPPRLVQAALALIDCDPDGDFEASLEMAIQGLRQLTPAQA